MVTKLWKFSHKMLHNSTCIWDSAYIFHQTGGFRVSQSNGVIHIF